MTNMSISVDDELKREIKEHADRVDRPKSWVVKAALEHYFQHQKWIAATVQDRLDAIERGDAKFVSHADARKKLLG